MSELLPCPFCGDVAAIKVSEKSGKDDWYQSFCVTGYCAVSPWHTVKADSIRWWNGHREALQQETDKDGERYRYLRDEETGDWIADRLTLRLPEDWDAFIDERMSAALPQKDGMK